MRVVLQRVSHASVKVDGQVIGQIGRGLLALVGIAPDDDEKTMRTLASKIVNLRIFDDADGKMNLSIADTGGALLAVSQFTLYADCRKGRRPSYAAAAPPEIARETFARFLEILRETGIPIRTGQFQAMMQVELINDGPVTIVLDSRDF